MCWWYWSSSFRISFSVFIWIEMKRTSVLEIRFLGIGYVVVVCVLILFCVEALVGEVYA